MPTQMIHPSAVIEPSARLAEDTIVGPGAQIGAQVVASIHVYIGANTLIDGAVTIQRGVRIGSGVILVGPLEIGEDGVIADGATIGAVPAQNSAQEQTLIGKGARIGEKAEVLGRLVIGDWSRVAPGARLEGDLPHHGLAVGSPASLQGFICACGVEYHLDRALLSMRLLACPAGHEPYRASASDYARRGRILLPDGRSGDPVPAWQQPA